MKILIIDNTIDLDSWGSHDLAAVVRSVAVGSTIEVRRAPARDLPENPAVYSHIVVSGSKTEIAEEASWIDEHDAFLKRAIDREVPTLGVCYGHQALARVLGGKRIVGPSKTPEVGWAKIEILSDDPLFDGLNRTFYSAVRHFDEVYEIPSGAEHLARSERCAIQAFRMSNRKVYGIQFHPERTESGMQKTFEQFSGVKNRQHIIGEKLRNAYDATVAARIFRNFLDSHEKDS